MNILILMLKYCWGGILTLAFLDTMNWLYAKNKNNNERYENSHRIVVFLFWPIMLLVWLISLVNNK